VAARLHDAEMVARQLSLTALNASFIVFRAGTRAAGLKVIADFFAEMASVTIRQSAVVNEIALQVSRISVSQWRLTEFSRRLEMVRDQYAQSGEARCTDRSHREAQERMRRLNSDCAEKMQSLDTELEEIWREMRAADVIVVSSRIEASKTGEYQASIVSMADSIKHLSDEIKAIVSESRELLGRT